MDIQIPEKLGFLFQPKRYKVIYGGRGGSRSWSCARALIARCIKEPIRVFCCREVQKSMRDSVIRLIADQIILLGVSEMFEVQETVIKVKNGGEITFGGLSSMTTESVKSMEGIDICWCEEATTIVKNSWDILIPTIRKAGSEIWITFNPSLESDDVYRRFVTTPRDDAYVCKLNYSDNPWFPFVLEQERLLCKATDPDNYDNIWEGACKPAVAGAIYFREIKKAEEEGRICNIPYDPMLKVHVVVDLGWNDAMSLILVQKHISEKRIIEYIEDDGKTLDYYSAILKEKRFNWGRLWLPHDGYSKDFKTGKSTEEIMKKLGWDVPAKEENTTLGIEDGIRFARMSFGQVYFDKEKAAGLVEHLKRYKRVVSREGISGGPAHDDASHGADAFRYMCLNADKMLNEDMKKPFVYHQGYGVLDEVVGI